MSSSLNPLAFLPSDLAGDTPLLSDESVQTWVDFDGLSDRAQFWANQLTGQRSLVFHYITNSVDGVAQFLGALRAGHAVALLDPKLPETSQLQLADCYKPGYIISAAGEVSRNENGGTDLHPDLFVLLSTSGSTGSSKLVRLTAANLTSNAKAIADVLDIKAAEVGCGHLPLHYSYGLSVLISHLVSGAPVFLTASGFIDAEFWTLARKWKVAHLPGVPFHFQMLARLRFERLNLPDLRVLTQAGGRLDAKLRKMAHDYMDSIGGRFHVMYGQTEAAPRITTMAHEDFVDCPDSVGTALAGGKLEIFDTNGADVPMNIEGEVVYSGPNVMMGYAETSADLALGDTQKGVIWTGDLGRLDAEGRLTITGRTKRIGKIAGLRVNIDEVERLLVEEFGEVAVIQQGENLVLYHRPEEDEASLKDAMRKVLISRFTLPSVAYKFRVIDVFPRSERGKIDYVKLANLATVTGK